MCDLLKKKIGVIGLGYVGLPLAVEFGKIFKTIGFDVNGKRVEELKNGIDRTLEVEPENLTKAVNLSYTTDMQNISDCNIYVVTVPTPINKNKQPQRNKEQVLLHLFYKIEVK